MTAQNDQLCAIVVSFNTGNVLFDCLQALSNDPLCSQIIIVDNGNPAPVVEELTRRASLDPKLDLFHGYGNIGFGRGCNLGASKAIGGKLVFVNPDCVIDPQTFPAFSRALSGADDVLLGGLLRNVDGSEQRGSRRGALTVWSALVSFSGLGRAGPSAGIWRDFNRTNEAPLTENTSMPVISGALLAIGAPFFQKLGGFDPDFFLHLEDVDLCKRAAACGGQVIFVPSATALHLGGTSAAPRWHVERAKIASFARYFWKHAESNGARLWVAIVMPFIAAAIILRMSVR